MTRDMIDSDEHDRIVAAHTAAIQGLSEQLNEDREVYERDLAKLRRELVTQKRTIDWIEDRKNKAQDLRNKVVEQREHGLLFAQAVAAWLDVDMLTILSGERSGAPTLRARRTVVADEIDRLDSSC